MKKYKLLIAILVLITLIFATMFLIKNKINVVSNNDPIGDLHTEISSYNNPIIPEGFKKLETETASWELEEGIPKGWNNGLVIEDGKGNQFVWVPCNYKDITFSDYAYRNYRFDENTLDENIKKYGGFYIARYEAGVDEKMQSILTNISTETNDIFGIPVSKNGVRVWDFISAEKAVVNAKNMYNTDNIASNSISMQQVLILMEWLYNSGYDVYNNSSSFGNYSNVIFNFKGLYSEDYGRNYKNKVNGEKGKYNIITSSGASERNKTNNIYDIAGNLWDCTSTKFEDNNEFYYSFGGHYDTPGNERSASTLNAFSNEPTDKLGFRVCLIIK